MLQLIRSESRRGSQAESEASEGRRAAIFILPFSFEDVDDGYDEGKCDEPKVFIHGLRSTCRIRGMGTKDRVGPMDVSATSSSVRFEGVVDGMLAAGHSDEGR